MAIFKFQNFLNVMDELSNNNVKKKSLWKRIPKWGRITLYSLGCFCLLLTLLVIGFAWYINHHKASFIDRINTTVAENIEGNFHVEDLDVAIFSTFPDISLRLKNITLSDSLYKQHHNNLVDVEYVYVHLHLFSLVSGNPKVKKVTIENGTTHLFVLKDGYSNQYLLKPKEKVQKVSKPDKELEVNLFELKNVQFIMDEHVKNKQFKIDLLSLTGNLYLHNNLIEIETNIKAFVH